jgi:copper chaperone
MMWVGPEQRTLPMSQTIEQLTYSVPGMSCGHCRAAITAEVQRIAGVASVDVDLDAKRVTVAGEQLDDAAVRAAIDEAGYDVA